MELLGESQSTFGDMLSELGISTNLRADVDYTLLAPFNTVFTGESNSVLYHVWHFCSTVLRRPKS